MDGKASQTSVNDVQTKVDTVRTSQYVPFEVALSGLPATCASAGQGNEFDKISIDGGADFMVTSILFNASGMDESSDNFRVNKVAIDGKDFELSVFYFKQPTAFDIMGALVLPSQNSGIQQQFPTTIGPVHHCPIPQARQLVGIESQGE